jgi:hypothetical protein
MSTPKPSSKPPTLADLDALPSSIVGEIIEGVLYTMTKPRMRHQRVTRTATRPRHGSSRSMWFRSTSWTGGHLPRRSTSRERDARAANRAGHRSRWLETSIIFAVRALGATYPAINQDQRPGDHAELTSTRELIDGCECLLDVLDAHW